MDELKDFIRHYCPLKDEDLETVVGRFSTRVVAKGKYILKQGQICNEFVYVISGLFRQYYKDINGREITAWISFEDTQASELSSFIDQQPAKFYVQALEESEIASISYADLQGLYMTIPALQEFGRKMAEKILVGAINRAIAFQKESAEERYKKLLQRPEYFQRVPLKYLASFIGVTDTSLSRLRRKRQ